MTKRPRVVHLVVSGEIGGAERMLVDLASHASSGADHAIAVVSPSEHLKRLFTASGLRIHDRGRVREGPLRYLWRSLGPSDVAWLADVLATEHADIVHLHTFGSHVMGTRAALRTKTRVLRTEHSTRVYDDFSCWPFSKWSLYHADGSVAVSEHVRRVALKRAPWAKATMRVVANGVDIDAFIPRHEERRDPFTFVLIGRLEPRKGVDLALEALARVPGVELLVVGDGAEGRTLQARARSLGVAHRTHFHPHQDDVRPLLARGHAILSSSRSEGLGLALLEAMAMALPVVGFAVGGVPESVVDGETGLLAPEGDVAALAGRMREASAAPDRMLAMGEAARKRVVARFSVPAMCAGYADVYEMLARPRP